MTGKHMSKEHRATVYREEFRKLHIYSYTKKMTEMQKTNPFCLFSNIQYLSSFPLLD